MKKRKKNKTSYSKPIPKRSSTSLYCLVLANYSFLGVFHDSHIFIFEFFNTLCLQCYMISWVYLKINALKMTIKLRKMAIFSLFWCVTFFIAFIENILLSNRVQYSYSSLFFIKANEYRKQNFSTKKLCKIYKPHS